MSSNPNPLSIALPNCGGAFSVHTSDIYQDVIQHASITLTSTQLTTMYTTPISLIAAAGAGTSIYVKQALLRFTAGATQFTGGGAVTIGYSGGAAFLDTLPASTITSASSSDSILGGTGANIACSQNTAVTITNATAVFAAGNGTLMVHLWYVIV